MRHTVTPFEAFLNERSFAAQFRDADGFQQAIVGFVALIEEARRAVNAGRGRFFVSERLPDAEVQQGKPLRQCLNHLAGAEFKSQFVDIIWNRANPAPWEPDPARHPADGYYLCTDADLPPNFERDVSDSSMAELAERQRRKQELIGCLLNIVPSPLAKRPQVTVDAEGTPKALDCVDDEVQLRGWLAKLATVPEYTDDTKYPPLDAQTCLVDGSRFELTTQMNKDRHVYRHITSGDLYAVDSLHPGRSAELEVFDRYGRHKGAADIRTGQLRPNTKVEGRYLRP